MDGAFHADDTVVLTAGYVNHFLILQIFHDPLKTSRIHPVSGTKLSPVVVSTCIYLAV